MIGQFPTAYPDELFYSLSARYSRLVSYPDPKSVLRELLGSTTASAVVDLPNRLSYLVSALPTGTSITSDSIIQRHTLLPFFSAFLPPERVRRLHRDMQSACGLAAHARSGIMASAIPQHSHLKFCPTCIQEDMRNFGETYWHRVHQCPGVEVCPRHQAFLENSSVSLRADKKNLQFISADQATKIVPVRRIDIENPDHQILLQVARNAEWLIENQRDGTSPEVLHSRYLRLLIGRGLATHTGSIRARNLLNDFSSQYSPALLKHLHCELRGNDIEKSNWLLRLVRSPKHTQHPLHHLLLIQFLGCTVEEFCQLPEELSPFGESPWPCLNLAASHYRQPVIIECEPSDRLRHGKPSGRFSCECGFAYVRTGPNSSPEDRFRIGRIISVGQIWEIKLKQLWEDSSLSVSEIGRRLGVDPLTVRRHAARLVLTLSRSGKRLKPLPRTIQLKGKAVSAAWQKKRYRRRSRWLSEITQGSEITLTMLRRKLPREYAWLRHNDSEWLAGHKPQPQRCNPLTASVDWKRRDAKYASAVQAAASRLKNTPGRPVRVTRTAIGRALGAIALLRQKLHKMPLTAQVLEGVAETRERFAVRRIWWAAEIYLQEGILPQEWQLIMKANVYSLRHDSAVKCAVESAMSALNSQQSQSKVSR